MSNETALIDNPEFVEDLKGNVPQRTLAAKWGCANSTVAKWRRIIREKDGLPPREKVKAIKSAVEAGLYRFEDDGTTVTLNTHATDVPQTMGDVYQSFRDEGLDPDDFDLQIRRSKWENGATEDDGTLRVLHACAITARRKTVATETAIDWKAASSFVENFTYVPAKRDFLVDSAILQPTDEQWGKTDFAGGTPQTEERVMNSYAAFADYVKEYRPRQILLARTGDGIENTCSVGTQRDTNDLDVPAMLVQSFKMDLRALSMIAPLAEEVINAYVTSNHGRWRTGLKADAGNPHADFGIAVGRQLQATQETLGVFPNVKHLFPDALMESMTVQLDTIRIGMTHGHLAGSPERLGTWWQGQDHGRMPTWDADVLLVGHFHSMRVVQSGDGRWIYVGPASDNGSSWFSNLKGERARAGMLALCVEGKRLRFQEIL